jgi:hypothetical protein
LGLENVVLTPHAGGYSELSVRTARQSAAAEMARILRGEKETDFPYSHDLAVQQTVLQANEEAENAIVAFLRFADQVRLLEESVREAREAERVAQVKYREGEIDFNRLAKLNLDADEGEDLEDYGFLYYYDRSYDKPPVKGAEKKLTAIDRAAYNITTSSDPIIQELAEKDERINAMWPAYEAALKANEVPDWSMTFLFERVIPELKERGMTDEQLDQMMVENPKRWLGS